MHIYQCNIGFSYHFVDYKPRYFDIYSSWCSLCRSWSHYRAGRIAGPSSPPYNSTGPFQWNSPLRSYLHMYLWRTSSIQINIESGKVDLHSHLCAQSSPNVPGLHVSLQLAPLKPGLQMQPPFTGEHWPLLLHEHSCWQFLPYFRMGHWREQSLLLQPGLQSQSPVHGWHLNIKIKHR